MSTKPKRKRAAVAAVSEAAAPVAEPVAAPEAVVAVVQPQTLEVTAPATETPVAEAPVVAAAPAIEPATQSAQPTVQLASNCTVKDAGPLKDALLRVLDEASVVTIDAKSVERIDTATVQLLCAFVRDRASRSLSVTWQGVPAALREAARLLGVSTMLTLPESAA